MNMYEECLVVLLITEIRCRSKWHRKSKDYEWNEMEGIGNALGEISHVSAVVSTCKKCIWNINVYEIHLTVKMFIVFQVIDNPVFTLAICPEKGLHAQNYRCSECHAPIGFRKYELVLTRRLMCFGEPSNPWCKCGNTDVKLMIMNHFLAD